MNIIETRALSKSYGSVTALRDCTLAIPEGHVVALVGPNGAGKSTLLNLSFGLAAPSAGEVTVLGGLPVGSAPALDGIAFVAQDTPLFKNLPAADLIHMTRNLSLRFDQGYAEHRLGELGVPLAQKAGKMSDGQQAQLALTLALARRPQLLVLDEPMAMLDPLARHDFMATVMTAIADDGVSVVLSSHVLAELERVADHCAACGHGFAPRDAELGVAGTSMSPGLTVPLPPSPLPDKLYGVIDGTGVPMTARETAGREGKGEDGRARTREVKLAVFFRKDKVDDEGFPIRDRGSSSYIATFEPAAVFGGLVKAEGTRRGADYVRQLTILGDGAAWIWNIATAKFPGATQIVDLFHAREHLNDLARLLEFMLLDNKDDWLAARLEDLDYGDIDGICEAARGYPLAGVKKDELDGPGYFENNALRRRRSRLQVSHRPAPQAIRNALDHRQRRRHHRPALPGGQQPVGSHLQHPAHSDTNRLTSPAPR